MPHKRSLNGKIKRQTRFLSYITKRQYQDAIRADIRSLSRRDLLTGEIAFHPSDRQKIADTLLNSGCKLEKTCNTFSCSPDGLEKHVHLKTEYEYITFDAATVNHVLNGIEDGQVLNRFTN